MKFVDNDRLAWLILEYFLACDYFHGDKVNIGNAIDWLKLSSSVDSINIDTAKHDDSVLYCGIVWDYEEARSKLMSSLSTELVRFHFVWGALESLIAEFVPSAKIKKFGKINALCGYLKKSNLEGLLPKGYVEEYNNLIELMGKINQYKNDIDAIAFPVTDNPNELIHVDIAGIGVYSVYRIRNKFAHGSMKFPEPESHDEDAGLNKELIIIATRIVLMTIIILLVNDIKMDDFVLDPSEFSFIAELELDSYEYSLMEQLDEDNFDFHKITATTYLRNLCTDRT